MKVFRYIVLFSLLFHFSCEEILFEEDISDQSVILTAPSDGVEIASNAVFFDWEPIDEATSYQIQVAVPNFDDTQQLLLNVTDTISFYELELNVGDYQWRVRAKNDSYETLYTAASFKVVPVVNFSDFTVILDLPENNLITNEPVQNLQWQNVDGATLYRVQILDNGTVLQEQTTQDTNFDITFPEGSLNWQVRAENGTENTLYTERNILVDITNPNIPTLILPEDEAILTSGDVSFEWTREVIEGSTEFDTIYVYRDVALIDLVLSEQVTSPFETTLTADSYYWFVKAQDEAGNEGDDSSVFSFTIN